MSLALPLLLPTLFTKNEPTNQNQSLHLLQYVLVSWRPPPIYQRNGVLLGYKIQYKRKGSRRGDLCTVITKEGDNQYVLTGEWVNSQFYFRCQKQIFSLVRRMLAK